MKSLAELAIQYGSDKHGHHYYCQHYEKHFEPFRYEECVFLEMGIGGYKFPDRGGAGLKMWRDWFINASVTGIDLYDKDKIIWPNKNLLVFQGSQNDPVFLDKLLDHIGRPNIIVDDASHNNRLTIESFELLFPSLRPGGIYAIEDIESSWWENSEFEGHADHTNYQAPTTINFIRRLMDDVMRRKIGYYKAKYPIKSIHLYDNMVFIYKEEN